MDYTEKKKSMNLDLVQLEDNFQHKNFKGKISCVYLGLKWVCRKCLSSYKLYISLYTHVLLIALIKLDLGLIKKLSK